MELIQLPNGQYVLFSFTTGIIHPPVFQKEKCTLRQIAELVDMYGIEEAVYAIGERGCEQWALWLIEHQHLFCQKEAA